MSCEDDSEFSDFIKTISLQELCSAAASCRDRVSCEVGEHIVGDEVSASYAATLKYLKQHSHIPVPTVFAFTVKSNPDNKVNATYILMEKLIGHQLPVLEDEWRNPKPQDLAMAKRVHEQLTDVILELASFKFAKIGSLEEDSNGNFFVGPYVDIMNTASQKQRTETYESLSPHHKGPFSSASDWYAAMSELNRKSAIEDPDDEEDKDVNVAQFELLAELSTDIIVEKFNDGPFVINHNDLTVQNILVDDEFNITGVLDFPGTIVPLASLCVFPWLFSDNYTGLVTERDTYLNVFQTRECAYASSALQSCDLRKELMENCQRRQDFEFALLGPYIALTLPSLFTHIKKRPFDEALEYQRVADTRGWFKKLIPPVDNGLYSWDDSAPQDGSK